MRTIEQAVVSWVTALTLLATTVSTLASEQPFHGGGPARSVPAGRRSSSPTDN